MSRTFAQTPLTPKQIAILTCLYQRVRRGRTVDCETIARVTGYRSISSTLHSLKFRGFVTLGRKDQRMVVTSVNSHGIGGEH